VGGNAKEAGLRAGFPALGGKTSGCRAWARHRGVGRCATIADGAVEMNEDLRPRWRDQQGTTVADEKTIALNRRARHDYTIDDTFEAGIVLTGTEIKSIRAGKVNLSDAYARIERDEAWLVGAHIAPFEQANRYNHEPKRVRKLLLHRGEIDELLGRTKAKGQTIVPLRLYLTGKGRAKLELGLARGKNLYDRRRDIADRDSKRDVAREMADAQRGR
jgi:SsrA-binding protein